MDTKQLKTYAPEARKKFIEAVKAKARTYGLTAEKIEPVTAVSAKGGDVVMIGGVAFPKAVGEQRKQLVERIRRQGFDAFIESVAYTWFNRFVAIRFMEINGYLSHGYRVLSAANADKTMPEILENAVRVELPGVDKNEVARLKLDGNKDEELYRLLLIGQCNELSKAMPFLFESIKEGTELLLPDNLLHSDSLIRTLVAEILEEQWKQVEVIGWLYQFYISERKDEVIGKVVASEDIPAATQLFTPNWIVKYLVQNTLGRQWMAVYPDSPLKNEMEYYIEPGEQEPAVVAQLKAVTPESLNPEELTFLDPACGSGHILVEAYDLFKRIYLERGYHKREIPGLILSKNLFGLEIDDRAAQLASFALMMKAREDDRRFFEREDKIQPNIVCFEETGDLDASDLAKQVNLPKDDIAALLDLFKHAKTFGSLIRVPESVRVRLHSMNECLDMIKSNGDLIQRAAAESLLPLVRQAEMLARQYDFVVANPPYMGNKGMPSTLSQFARDNYPDSKSDLFAMFIERNGEFARKNGFFGLITMQSWMFLSSFEKLRANILARKTLLSMAHLGPRAFDTISGEVVSTTAFVNRNIAFAGYQGEYFRLIDYNSEVEKAEKHLEAIKNPACGWFYRACADDFKKIPGSPVAYWVEEVLYIAFESGKLKDVADAKQGIATSDNERFLRFWHEVSYDNACFDCKSSNESTQRSEKWYAYNKGGTFRRWYGNNDYVINWYRNGKELKIFVDEINKLRPGGRLKNQDYYFGENITYSALSSGPFSARHNPPGFLFDTKGSCIFPKSTTIDKLILFLNSNVAQECLNILCPTLDYSSIGINALPVIDIGADCAASVQIKIARSDWDAYETSWDFLDLPLLRKDYRGKTLAETYQKLSEHWRATTLEMQRLEEENNRIFIDAYGLQDELTPDVPLKEITLTCNPAYRYGGDATDEELETRLQTDTIKEFLSYAVGCAMGRYSLDLPGLVIASQGESLQDYSLKHNEALKWGVPTHENADPDDLLEATQKHSSFLPDWDGIIPLLERDWSFKDDMAQRFEEFLIATFAKEHLKANLRFVEDSLGKSVRDYFAKDFFADHMKRYKKRPIYWLFSSGKQRAFQCIVYLHRYHAGTLARMRTEYLVPLQSKITGRLEQIEMERKSAGSTAAEKRLDKERDLLIKQADELRAYDEKLRHYADMKIELDLDDGVKVNYGKFGDLLASVKDITGEKPNVEM